MPSSTFSFNRELPSKRQAAWLVGGLLFGCALVLAAELAIRALGIEPSIRDSEGLWHVHRDRAAKLGNEAIILVGASRLELAIDLGIMEDLTGRPVVQLAMNGGRFLEVVQDLAADTDVTGTVLIDATLKNLAIRRPKDRTTSWIASYHERFRGLLSPRLEQHLVVALQSVSALYGNPYGTGVVIRSQFGGRELRRPYIETRATRERLADYTLLDMPVFYTNRMRGYMRGNLGDREFESTKELEAAVIETTYEMMDQRGFTVDQYGPLNAAVATMRSRNVNVAFVELPTGRGVKIADDIWQPAEAWRDFRKLVGVPVIRAPEHPQLMMPAPDGSHLDRTHKTEFTRELTAVLQQQGIL